MTDKKWKPDEEEALKALIRATVMAAGPIDPATIPHQVKDRIKEQATGDLDVDAYIREVMAEAKRGK
jgi:hypothetical protein